MLQSFLETRCAKTGTVPLKDLLAAFRQQLPAAELKRWTRSIFLAELVRLGYHVGDVDGRTTVANCSLPTNYSTVNGRLVKA